MDASGPLPVPSPPPDERPVELELVPGKALGPFTLGSPLPEVVQYMRMRGMLYRHVELLFPRGDGGGGGGDGAGAPAEDVLLHALPRGALRLRFCGVSQRLKVAEVVRPAAVRLRYEGARLLRPTHAEVVRAMGPAIPGAFDDSCALYSLGYPGCAFTFAVPQREAAALRHGGEASPPLPPALAADGAFRLSRAAVFGGRHLEAVHPPPPRLPGDPYFERVSVRPGAGLHFELRDAWLTFDSSVQDVLTELGAPDRVFERPEPRGMKVHQLSPRARGASGDSAAASGADASPALSAASSQQLPSGSATPAGTSPSLQAMRTPPHAGLAKRPPDAEGRAAAARRRPAAASAADYFYNYFSLGLDVLFDGTSHRARKFVLHANAPSSPDFHRYHRCNFYLPVPAAAAAAAAASASAAAPASSAGSSPLGSPLPSPMLSPMLAPAAPPPMDGGLLMAEAGGAAASAPAGARAVGPATAWEEARRLLGDPGKPLVASPSSRFYAYPGAVFQVTSAGEVSSLAVCEPGPGWDARWWGV